MLEPIIDLYGGTSWNYIFRRTIEARDGDIPNSFIPIPDEVIACQSNLVLIGCRSPKTIPLTWKVGCWASLNLGIIPDSTTDFPPFVRVIREAIPFRIFHLLAAPRYPPGNFYLRLEFPYWIESIYIEALAYDGEQTTRESQQINEILQRLNQ